MSSSTIIMILFRIINTSILALLGIHIAKKSIIPSLKEEIKASYNFFLQLQNKVAQLEVATQEATVKLEHEQEHYIALQQKINQWNLYLETVRKKEDDYYCHVAEKFKLQTEDRKNQIQKIYVLQKIAPEVIDTAQDELKKLLSQGQKAEQFLKHIIVALDKQI